MLAAPALACALALLSCGSGNGKSVDPPGLLSGNWQIALLPSPPATSGSTESGFLLQSGNSVTGQLVLLGQGVCRGLGSAQGTLTGSDIDIAVTQTGQMVAFSGKAATDGSTMGGTYAILGEGCGSGSSTGTWAANPVKPVTGTYLATFDSYTLGVYSFTVTLTQAANTGVSVAALSGTMSSSGAPCGNNLTVAGVVSGTSIVLNFLTSDGTAVGQFTGTTTTDAATLSGTYDFLAQTSGACVSGDFGTITLARQ